MVVACFTEIIFLLVIYCFFESEPLLLVYSGKKDDFEVKLYIPKDHSKFLCSLDRLGGLLGNYNGDASDDVHGPGGQAAQDVAQLATLWAISPTPCYQVLTAPSTSQ